MGFNEERKQEHGEQKEEEARYVALQQAEVLRHLCNNYHSRLEWSNRCSWLPSFLPCSVCVCHCSKLCQCTHVHAVRENNKTSRACGSTRDERKLRVVIRQIMDQTSILTGKDGKCYFHPHLTGPSPAQPSNPD